MLHMSIQHIPILYYYAMFYKGLKIKSYGGKGRKKKERAIPNY